MERLHLPHRLLVPLSTTTASTIHRLPPSPFHFNNTTTTTTKMERKKRCCYSTAAKAKVGGGGGWWLSGLMGNKKASSSSSSSSSVGETVKAGDPVLHEAAQEVAPNDIPTERIQNIVDNMISTMRKAPGVGLAAPQIGIPLRIIVLEDTKEYISYAPKNDIEAQDRRPFDLLVILNPKLRNTSNRIALFFEGCLSIDGYRAVVERHLDVQVSGLDRNGRPIKIEATGWQARILQHECDHLNGTLYVDKMVPKTFRTTENLNLPLPVGCPPLGVR